MQIWSFSGTRITIGRGDEETLVLADPYVSRVHAELVGEGGVWELISRGRSGVYVEGKVVSACPLVPGMTFRLGPAGPMFRFGTAYAPVQTSTLSFDADSVIVLAFNRQAVEKESEQIAETDYFRRLQEKARELRKPRESEVQ